MSRNQSRIHSLPSQSDDDNNNNNNNSNNNNNNNDNRAPFPPPSCGKNKIDSRILNVLVVIMIMLGVILFIASYNSTVDETVICHAVNGLLTQFDLTKDNYTLHYNFTIDINMTNPNGDYIRQIEYDEIEATALYQHKRFDSVNLMPFYQDYNNRSTILHTVFHGQSLVPGLGEYSKLSDRFYRDKSDGSFDIQVEVSAKITYHNHYLGWIRMSSVDREHSLIKCDSRRVPLFNLSSSSSIYYEWKQHQQY